MRGSLEGIVSTSLGDEHPCNREWLLRQVKWQAQRAALCQVESEFKTISIHTVHINVHLVESRASIIESADAFCNYIDTLDGDIEHFLRTVFCNADATKLGQFAETIGRTPIEFKNIWFQSPWGPWNSKVSPRALLCNFFKSAAEVQVLGDCVYIGIFSGGCHKHNFHHKYDLRQVVEAAQQCGYEPQTEVDRDLICQCHKFGYIPYTSGGMSLECEREYQVTHIFTRT